MVMGRENGRIVLNVDRRVLGDQNPNYVKSVSMKSMYKWFMEEV